MKDVFIIDGCRTAIGSFRGTLSSVRADDLAAIPIKALMAKYNNALNNVDEVILGCANQAGEDNRNIARMATLLAGLPFSIPAETVNRLCASGMSAVIHAYRSIFCGDAKMVIAGGIEHMTRAPMVMSKSVTPFGGDIEMYDSSFGWRFINPIMKRLYGTEAMGETAENLADLYQIDRASQDKFALLSQQKAYSAQQAGRFKQEIVPVEVTLKKQQIVFDQDEFLKPNTSLEGLSQLNPAFRKVGGSVTAGNASGLNDGAAAILVASEEAVTTYGFSPLARIVSSAVVGVEPRVMGIGPVDACKKAVQRAGLKISDMDIIEINEAFAVQVLACLKLMDIDPEDDRVNPNGGSIALGHPLGMSGTRILLAAALELKRQSKRYALVSMCIGVGQGYAVVLENVDR